MTTFRIIALGAIAIFPLLKAAPDKYENLDPQVAQFLKKLAAKDGTPIYELTPQEARKVLDDLQAPSVNTIPASIQDIVIPGKITKEISLRIVRPKNLKGKLPVVIYIHGGGWILGNKNTHDRLIREIANGARAAVVFVNYTPSPEAKYPVAIEQAYEASKYIAENGSKYELDTRKIAIAGDSVGGLMSTVVAQLAKERSGPKFIYQALLYPVTDANFDTSSYNEFADAGFWLSKKAMQWFWDAYAPVEQRKLPHVAPLNATIAQLRGLPPALILVDANDVLRDEGEKYAIKLMHAGVDVSAARILGTVHDFCILDPLKNSAPTKFAIDITTLKLRQAFYGKNA